MITRAPNPTPPLNWEQFTELAGRVELALINAGIKPKEFAATQMGEALLNEMAQGQMTISHLVKCARTMTILNPKLKY